MHRKEWALESLFLEEKVNFAKQKWQLPKPTGLVYRSVFSKNGRIVTENPFFIISPLYSHISSNFLQDVENPVDIVESLHFLEICVEMYTMICLGNGKYDVSLLRSLKLKINCLSTRFAETFFKKIY